MVLPALVRGMINLRSSTSPLIEVTEDLPWNPCWQLAFGIREGRSMSRWIPLLHQLLHRTTARIDTPRAVDFGLLVIVIAAMVMNLVWALAAARGWNMFFGKVSETPESITFPANPQLFRLSFIFVPLGILLAHQHIYSWARWQTFSHLDWLWLLVSLVWIIVPLAAWPGALVLEQYGLRQPSLLSGDKYIPYDEITEIRWRQLSIIVVGKSGLRLIHTPSHAARTLFEDELLAHTDAKTTQLHWED